MTRLRIVILLVFAPVLLSACAMGNKYDYRMASMPIPVAGSGTVGLKVADERPYILDGDKNPDFVGLQRGGYGNPFDVTTVSGQPMAQDMAETLKGALEDDGFRVVILDGQKADPEVLTARARAAGAQRVILLRIKEWKTDTALRVTLHYDLHLFVFDNTGALLAQNRLEGTSVAGGAAMPSAIGTTARHAFEQKMGQLFYPPKIRAALGSEALENP